MTKKFKCQKDWHRQTPHFTYVTRARTTQPPSPSPSTTPTTTTTELPETTTTSAGVDVDDEVEDDDQDDYYRPSRPESGTVSSNWPDRIDPIPTFWPTQNWWGTIDPMRQDPGGAGGSARGGGGQSRQSNRIPTYGPTPAKPAGNNNNNRNRNRADEPARSASSRPSPPPYFQLLLAGLVQVRWPLCWASLPWLLGRRRRPLLAIVSVVVAAASRFQILA